MNQNKETESWEEIFFFFNCISCMHHLTPDLQIQLTELEKKIHIHLEVLTNEHK